MTTSNIGLAGVLNSASEIETYVSQHLSVYLTGVFKNLLENKHLYQNLSIDPNAMEKEVLGGITVRNEHLKGMPDREYAKRLEWPWQPQVKDSVEGELGQYLQPSLGSSVKNGSTLI